MVSSRSPIGVFDSGIGGLTVLQALSAHLPQESFIYLGDLARVPYGSKSADAVTRYSLECATALRDLGVKALVVACNTATALALPSLQEEVSLPVVGVIEAGVRAGGSTSSGRRVLVLATSATISSHVYKEVFGRMYPDILVEELACPLLVPLAEEGWWHHRVTGQVIEHYLSEVSLDFDTIVLGCTHYPLLEPSFRKVVADTVALVHGADELAAEVRQQLLSLGLVSDGSQPRSIRFLSTDRAYCSRMFTASLFVEPVAFEHLSI